MIVLAVMAALFISFFQSMNTNLPSYQEGTDVEPVASEEPELLDFPQPSIRTTNTAFRWTCRRIGNLSSKAAR